jgi:Mce-associated membrane protein
VTDVGRPPRALLGWTDRRLPSGRGRVLLAICAVGVALLSSAGAAFLAVRAVETIRAEQAGPSALAAAQDLTPKLLNFDYKTIDADLARSHSVTTGEFWSQNSMLGPVLKPTVVQEQASTQTVVRGAGVVSAAPDKVVTLLLLNQTTNGKNLSAPQVSSRSARVTVSRADGQWLIAGFEPL